MTPNSCSQDQQLQRAKRPLVERQRKNEQTNAHWSFRLPQMLNDVRAKAAMLAEVGAYEAVTTEQVLAFFRGRIARRPPVEIAAKAKGAADAN